MSMQARPFVAVHVRHAFSSCQITYHKNKNSSYSINKASRTHSQHSRCKNSIAAASASAAFEVAIDASMDADAGSAEGDTVQDFLAALEEHKKACERAGKYTEADMAKKQLEDLRMQEVTDAWRQWRQRHGSV